MWWCTSFWLLEWSSWWPGVTVPKLCWIDDPSMLTCKTNGLRVCLKKSLYQCNGRPSSRHCDGHSNTLPSQCDNCTAIHLYMCTSVECQVLMLAWLLMSNAMVVFIVLIILMNWRLSVLDVLMIRPGSPVEPMVKWCVWAKIISVMVNLLAMMAAMTIRPSVCLWQLHPA